jgi:hypothetical protein
MGNPFSDHEWHRGDSHRGADSARGGRLSAVFGGLLASAALALLAAPTRSKAVMLAAGLVGAAGGLLGAMALWRFRSDPPRAGWWFLALAAVWVSLWPVAQGFGITAMFWHWK